MEGLIILAVVVGIPLYFLPSIIAIKRSHRQRGPIFALNFLLGWSLLGWAGSLAWALAAGQEEPKLPPPPPPRAHNRAAVTAAVSAPVGQTGAGTTPDDDIDEDPDDVVRDAALALALAVENSRTRTIRWRDAGQFLDDGLRRRASRAGVLNLPGESLTAAIEQGLLMLLDRKAPDARVARTSEPLPELGSPDTADGGEADENSQGQQPQPAATEPAAADSSVQTAAAPEPEPDGQDAQLLENLESLIRMHERGVLSDDELEAAKRRLPK